MSNMGPGPDREETTADDGAETDIGRDHPAQRGVDVIRDAVRTMPQTPGVYRMVDGRGGVLYVGKARNLKKRVTSYTFLGRQPVRLLRMIAQTASMEIVVTHTEAEALLLEANLIKRFKPRYNIILRDDKSYPYILLRGDHPWPQLVKHRGAQGKAGRYFGPFASAGAVNRTLNALQRAFPLRTCSDANFENRTRPCLQYQIKRCTAPCVNYIGREEYDELADQSGAFLAGKSQAVQRTLAQQMQEASDRMEFERAAVLRDRIRALTQVQSHQDINLASVGDADVIGAAQEGDTTCVQVFFFRGGRNYGNRSFFPAHTRGEPMVEVMSAFLSQFYEGKQPPPLLLLSDTPEGEDLIASALTLVAERKVTLSTPRRGDKKKLVDHAVANAREALARRLSESATQRRLLDAVAEAFGLEGAPQRIEVYDNSHISGTDAVGAMIVAGPDGFVKNAYRKFNIRKGPDGDLAAGDDYGMMRQVLSRRFGRLLKEDPDRERGQWPDLVLIDGGAGQLSSAEATLADLGVEGVPLVAIAKGPDRDSGRERFFMLGRPSFMLRPGDPVLYFLQRLRDEAHRFAIGTHRARRSKGITRSDLDEIPGIGAKRKRSLLHHFGSARAVREAGLADLESAEGINKRVARTIYDHFHTGD